MNMKQRTKENDEKLGENKGIRLGVVADSKHAWARSREHVSSGGAINQELGI